MKKKNTTLANYDIVLFFFTVKYLPDGVKSPKYVVGLLCDCIYCYIELLCSCWNKHCKIIVLHGT
jgi:hypothetical protein